MIGLTAKQRRVLTFIQETYRRTGKEPAYREIAEMLSVTVRAAAQHVEALERKGYLTRSRGIVLPDEHRPPRGIPLLGRVAAGRPILADENIEEYLDTETLFGITEDDKLFALRVRGDSMTGAGILDGDMLLVRPTRKATSGEIVVALLGDEVTVKTYRSSDDGTGTVLEAANEDYGPIDITRRRDASIVGKVMTCHRRL